MTSRPRNGLPEPTAAAVRAALLPEDVAVQDRDHLPCALQISAYRPLGGVEALPADQLERLRAVRERWKTNDT